MKLLKIFGIIVLFWSIAFAASAQDVLITSEGDAHKVFEIEIGGSSIFYKLENKPEAAIQKIDKTQVLMIKYQDGRKVIIGEEEKLQTATPVQHAQEQTPPTALSQEMEIEIQAINAKIVEEYNKIKVEYVEPKDKKANALFCTFGLKEDARLQDDKVKIVMETGVDIEKIGRGYTATGYLKGVTDVEFHQGILVSVINNSTNTIYIDLGNSFFVRNGEATPYYIPSSTSSTSGTSSGVGVNMGSVAGALGVGGVIGTLAGGVNVGGGKSSSSTTVTYAQRVVAIPPKSQIKLDFQKFFPEVGKYWKLSSSNSNAALVRPRIKTDEDFNIKRGKVITFTEEEETLNFGIRISYSLNESCQQMNNLYADIYLKEMLGANFLTGTYVRLDVSKLSPNWKDVLHMVVGD